MKSPLVSVVVPVYNAEKYLDECILSIVNQNIGFTNNVELILINDGSVDGSGKICEKYANQFSDNIVYIDQKNSGVSHSRNKGIKAARGQFISFLDSDDKLSKNFLSEAVSFFDKNPKINLAFAHIKRFDDDGREWYSRHQDRFFNEEYGGIVDTRESNFFWPYSQSVIYRSKILDKHHFDESLALAEDGKFINSIVFENPIVGLLESAEYYYRKGLLSSATSSLSMGRSSIYFFDVYEKFIIPLAEDQKRQTGKVSDFLQNSIIYALSWRLKNDNHDMLTDEQYEKYISLTKKIINYLDDEKIAKESKTIGHIKRLYLFALKNNLNGISEVLENSEWREDGKLYYTYKDTELMIGNGKRAKFFIDQVRIKNKKLIVEGYHNYHTVAKNIKFYCKLDDSNQRLQYVSRGNLLDVKMFNKTIYSHNAFKVEIPISDISSKSKLTFGFTVGEKSFTANIATLQNRFLHGDIKGRYKKVGKFYVEKRKKSLTIRNATKKNFLRLESKYYKQLLKEKKLKVIINRTICHLAKATVYRHKDIWLISDRGWNVGDNGDYFYRYAVTQTSSRITPYFIIKKDHPRYKELKKQHLKVVDFGSFKYKLLMTVCTKRISTHCDVYITRGIFGEDDIYYDDLYTFDFIYLKHAITSQDVSGYLNRYAKGIDLITAATNNEYKILVNDSFGYTKKDIALTGFPRFDALLEGDNSTTAQQKYKYIMIAPTWRRSIAGKVGDEQGYREYNEEFRDTDYFKFYSELLTNTKLLKLLKENNYKIEFYLHPAIYEQAKDFLKCESDNVKIAMPPHNYVNAFKRSSIMVTDYSGVQFDFAYQYRPIVYSQFDIDTLYSTKSHIYQAANNEYSYEKDAFGPVAKTVDRVRSELEKLIQNDAKMPKKYLDRAKKFFAYHDGKSAERIYQAILKYDKEKEGVNE